MTDTNHLAALEIRRCHEINRLVVAKSRRERELRTVWIKQIENEISQERKFLGLPDEENEPEMTMGEILAELEEEGVIA